MTGSIGWWEMFWCFFKLGCSSFGGPVAHLGYFHSEFVLRRHWLSEQDYAQLVALCQFLPGPTSSQVGMALGLLKGRYAGALAAWLGFTLPSALLLVVFALGLSSWQQQFSASAGLLQGLKIVTVAVVIQAVWGMAKSLCNSTVKLMLLVILLSLLLGVGNGGIASQLLIILLGAFAGWCWLPAPKVDVQQATRLNASVINTAASALFTLGFIALLLLLPLFSANSQLPIVTLLDSFYRAGALVFGGGHVVLPLLQTEMVANGLVDEDLFLAGYAAAQAVPGPLFSFAAYVGAVLPTDSTTMIQPLLQALVATVAVFLPGFLLLCAAFPFWVQLRCHSAVQAALSGVGVSVVAILAAVLYQPIWQSAIHRPGDLLLLALALLASLCWRLSPIWVVSAGALVGAAIF